MINLSYTENTFFFDNQQYQKGDISQITYYPNGIVHIKMNYSGRSYKAHYSEFVNDVGDTFDTLEDLQEYLSNNFFFSVNGAGDFVSSTDNRIAGWSWAGNRFKAGNHDCRLNAYSGGASLVNNSLWVGGGMLVSGTLIGYPGNGWNGSLTVGIPTLGERIKIRGFYFSSFESANQGIYTILRTTGSAGIDTADSWYKMLTEKDIAQNKVDALTGSAFGAYWTGVPRVSGTGTGTLVTSNYLKFGNVVMVSLTLSFTGLTTGANNIFEVGLPVLSSYTNEAYNVVHSINGTPVGGSFEITKPSVDILQIKMSPTLGAFTLELDIKYRL